MNLTYCDEYDVIVVGAGHAGVEAALAAARIGAHTALLTGNLDTVALMSCNPAIGGIGKGQIVREIDALGGAMGRMIDRTGIQFRLLNRRKGAAMQGPRAQADKTEYHTEIKQYLENRPNLELRQETALELLVEQGAEGPCINGLRVEGDRIYRTRRLVLCCGTFVRGMLHCGRRVVSGGRASEAASVKIGESLVGHGIELRRFRTDTPPRINARTIDYRGLTEHPGDTEPIPFSFLHDRIDCEQISCWMTWTTPELHRLIREHLAEAPAFSGRMNMAGPRYCPSIETKIDRFGEKERHQLFLEPEGRRTQEVYINGFSTGFGRAMQERMIRLLPGLEKAQIMRHGYAIEYDYATPEQLRLTLETKRIAGLYLAGQLNGTTGYEEAAALGLMAGANAALAAKDADPFILGREQAYIGVMIDDLVTRGVDEPYRMFTSRAEYRLLLRHDNADRRLTPLGDAVGLIEPERRDRLDRKLEAMWKANRLLESTHDEHGSMEKRLSRPETSWEEMIERIPELAEIPLEAARQVATDTKYHGYIARQEIDIERQRKLAAKRIPGGTDYAGMTHLRFEAREKFARIQPVDLAQASRISGITPADLAVLAMYLR